MSVLDRLKKASKPDGKKLFCVIAGQRLAGKSSLAGTLPGKTLMLQAAVLESGSESARALARRMGNELDVVAFNNNDELLEVLKELTTDTTYDNVFVDSLTAVTEQKSKEPAIIKMTAGNGFAAYKQIGVSAIDILEKLKELTYAEKAKKAKNAFIACALKVKLDSNGEIAEVELESRGQMAVVAVTKYGEAVVTVLAPMRTETGETPHRLLTKTRDCWPGRVDGLLADQNPGEIDADLGKLLALFAGRSA